MTDKMSIEEALKIAISALDECYQYRKDNAVSGNHTGVKFWRNTHQKAKMVIEENMEAILR